MALERWGDYSRRDVHDVFEPESTFTPNSGTWGIHGIIELRGRPGDFVFFVTFGQEQAGYAFDEAVSESGVLTWQSQPRETLSAPRIRALIAHDDAINTIHLFLRTSDRRPYTYMGRLRYLTHDAERERPVHFQWQILNWDKSNVGHAQGIGLSLVPDALSSPRTEPTNTAGLVVVPSPPVRLRRAVTTDIFKAWLVPDRSIMDERNRSLGRAGEELVLALERARLSQLGRSDLAGLVRHIAAEEGDGAGFDIASYDERGQPIYIEVKTTTGVADTPFFVSSNELSFARRQGSQFKLYRVYDFVADPPKGKVYIIDGDLEQQFTLYPTQYRATLNAGSQSAAASG